MDTLLVWVIIYYRKATEEIPAAVVLVGVPHSAGEVNQMLDDLEITLKTSIQRYDWTDPLVNRWVCNHEYKVIVSKEIYE